MLGSNILEVAVGIIFVFLLVSTICTAIREGIEAKLKTRAAYLEHGIRQLLKDAAGSGLAAKIYNHPSIFGLFNGSYTPGAGTDAPSVTAKGGNLPSYIPSKNFAVALMDIAASGSANDHSHETTGDPVIDLKSLRENVLLMDNKYMQRVLLNAIDTAQGDINKVQKNIEAWYDSGMDRVSGWYKRSTQTIIFVIALTVTVAMNINTITIAGYLSKNEAQQKVLVERATAAAKDTTYKTGSYDTSKSELDALALPVGWPDGWASFGVNHHGSGFWNWFLGPILGLLLTAFAATLGAPFWFDMLNKVMVIRSTVKPHEKSGEEASQDRQAPAAPAPAPAAAPVVPAPDAAAPAPAPAANIEDIDGCDVTATDLTADHQLPPSEGGII